MGKEDEKCHNCVPDMMNQLDPGLRRTLLYRVWVILMSLFNDAMTKFSATVQLSSTPNSQAQALPTPTRARPSLPFSLSPWIPNSTFPFFLWTHQHFQCLPQGTPSASFPMFSKRDLKSLLGRPEPETNPPDWADSHDNLSHTQKSAK